MNECAVRTAEVEAARLEAAIGLIETVIQGAVIVIVILLVVHFFLVPLVRAMGND